MSELNHRPMPDILDQAADALRAASAPAGPPAELVAATVAAIEQQARVERRRKIMRYVRYSSFATAAAVLVAVGAGLFFSSGELKAANFKLAMENAGKAKSMVVTNVQQMRPDGPELTFRMYARGHQLRMDLSGVPAPGVDPKAVAFSLIGDMKEGRAIDLNHPEKTAVVRTVEPRKGAPGFPDLAENFRRLKDETDITRVGREQLNGRPADKFTLKSAGFIGGSGPADVTVWIDPATNLPVKVLVKAGPMTLRFEDFQFGEELADELFSVEVPKGYTVKPAPKPPEADKK